MLAARTLRPAISRLHHARRWLATETTIPIDSSPEFLQEEQRKFGKLPELPRESEEEQRKRYAEFLEKKALEKPLRPQLNIEVNENHGLWAFFRKMERGGKEINETIEEKMPGKTDRSGRSWNAFELRRKSFKDLHTLWYILLRERNLLATQKAEATRLGASINGLATVDREHKVRKSMARIKQVINERRLAYEGALALQQGKSASKTVPTAEEAPLRMTDKQAIAATRGRRPRRGPSAAAIYRAGAFKEAQEKGAEGGSEQHDSNVDGQAVRGESDAAAKVDTSVVPEEAVHVEQAKV